MLYNEAFLSMENLMEYLNTYDLDHICAESTLYLGEKDLKKVINQPIANHMTEQKTPALLKNILADVKSHWKEYSSFYQQLSDPDSQHVFFQLIKYRLAPIPLFLSDCYSFKMAYLDNTILNIKENRTIIDYGENPDVYVNYLQSQFPNYDEIVIYAPDKKVCTACHTHLAEIPRLQIIQARLGSKTLNLKLPNPINPKLTEDFLSVSLDEALKKPLSYLRINANGQESEVLIGAKQHIKEDKPSIALCVGNTVSDLWKLPSMLKEWNPDYDFYLRHYSTTSICDTVLYAVSK